MYRPPEAAQMTTAMRLQVPEYRKVNGVTVKTMKDVEGKNGVIMCNFKTYGGTEKVVNDALAVENTADIVCWFRPDITSDCGLKRLSDGAEYEILGDPENLEQRNAFLKFKIRRIKGGA